MTAKLLLLFTLFTLALSKPRWDQELQGEGGEIYNTQGFSAYKRFTEKLEDFLAHKLKDSFSFIFRVSGQHSSEFLSFVNAERFIFLQLLYSFSEKDIVYSNLLLKVSGSVEIYRPENLKHWIEDTLKLDKEEMYRIMKHVAEGKINGLTDVPHAILDQLMYMNNKYKIFEYACSKNDTRTIQWFIDSGFDLSLISWADFENAWTKGYLEVVKILLSNNFLGKVYVTRENVHKTVNNETIFHIAAKYGFKDCLAKLLKLGANVNVVDADGKYPLYYAALANELGVINFLILKGASVGVVNQNTRDSLLHIAVSENNVNLAAMLLEMGIPPDSVNKEGVTPLYMAVEKDLIQLIYVLSFHGANVNVTGNNGDTLMHLACKTGNMDTVETLILLGSAVDKKNIFGETPLYIAAKKENVPLMKTLLKNGADLYTEDRRGRALLQKAAMQGDVVTASSLLKVGAKVNRQGSGGETALLNAANEGETEMVKVLLMFGANPNISDGDGYTALHKASKWGFSDIVILLLSNGANPIATSSDGWSPLALAKSNGHKNVAEILTDQLNPDTVAINVRNQ